MNNNIKVIHERQEKRGSKWHTISSDTSWISLDTFEESFVSERWAGERRYDKRYTKLGYYHTKTIVKFDDNLRSVRTFEFPK